MDRRNTSPRKIPDQPVDERQIYLVVVSVFHGWELVRILTNDHKALREATNSVDKNLQLGDKAVRIGRYRLQLQWPSFGGACDQ
eukprot:14033138-Alexandrium_andersonii.AAC.1